MKKLIIVFSVLLTISCSVAAQFKDAVSSLYPGSVTGIGKEIGSHPLHVGFGISFGKPVGSEIKNISHFSIAGDLQLEYLLMESLSATASAGVEARLSKGGVVNTKNYAPLLAGLRYYVSKFFTSEQAGYSVAITKGLKGAFTDVVGIGYKFSSNSDVMLAYKGLFYSKNSSSSIGSVGAETTGTTKNIFSTIEIRAAFQFGK